MTAAGLARPPGCADAEVCTDAHLHWSSVAVDAVVAAAAVALAVVVWTRRR